MPLSDVVCLIQIYLDGSSVNLSHSVWWDLSSRPAPTLPRSSSKAPSYTHEWCSCSQQTGSVGLQQRSILLHLQQIAWNWVRMLLFREDCFAIRMVISAYSFFAWWVGERRRCSRKVISWAPAAYCYRKSMLSLFSCPLSHASSPLLWLPVLREFRCWLCAMTKKRLHQALWSARSLPPQTLLWFQKETVHSRKTLMYCFELVRTVEFK